MCMKIKRYYGTFLSIAIILSITLVIIYEYKDNIPKKNLKSLKYKISKLQITNDHILLNDITPFKWDKVYSFIPYYPKEEIYKIIGFKSNIIKETVDETMMQIIFVKNKEIVCYLYGYPNNNFAINFKKDKYNNGAIILEISNKNRFNIIEEEKIIYLNHID